MRIMTSNAASYQYGGNSLGAGVARSSRGGDGDEYQMTLIGDKKSEVSVFPGQESGLPVLFGQREEPAFGQKNNEEGNSPFAKEELTQDELQIIHKLQARDREVRSHEQAHIAAGGGNAGAPSFEYQLGPDGKRYVVGGHVGISISGGGSPEETIRKMRVVERAALAPARPSATDVAVASKAAQLGMKAQMQLREQKLQEMVEQKDQRAEAAKRYEENSATESSEGPFEEKGENSFSFAV